MPTPRITARFAARAWKADLDQASPAGAEAARAARRRYTRNGVPFTELRRCEADARDGTSLPDCVKVYLPPPDGRFGMVFQFRLDGNKPTLMYLAFGVRHHPPASHAPTVYDIAHRRLHNTQAP
jgi:hypothetical protein